MGEGPTLFFTSLLLARAVHCSPLSHHALCKCHMILLHISLAERKAKWCWCSWYAAVPSTLPGSFRKRKKILFFCSLSLSGLKHMWCRRDANQRNKTIVKLSQSLASCTQSSKCIKYWLFGITLISYHHINKLSQGHIPHIVSLRLFFKCKDTYFCGETLHTWWLCVFLSSYLNGPECFWWQSLLPSAGQELAMLFWESVLSNFECTEADLVYTGKERKKEREGER